MENVIQFIANYADWQSIKKLKIEEKTDARMIMEFLASLTTGIDGKIEANLRKTVDLETLDAALNEISFGKSEQEIAEALRAVNSRSVGAAIKEVTAKPEFQKNVQKELGQFCRVYALKKVLKNCELGIDYSDIDIPGMKRMKKKKV